MNFRPNVWHINSLATSMAGGILALGAMVRARRTQRRPPGISMGMICRAIPIYGPPDM